MASEHSIFVGFEVSAELRACLEECSDRDRVYLTDPAHLVRLTIDGQEHIGKVAENGLPADRLDDTARSVVSLLNRVNPECEFKVKSALIIPFEGNHRETDGAVFDYTGLVR